MDISITTMTSTHLFIAVTLFSVLLLWIFLFATLALRPAAKPKAVEPATALSSIAQAAPVASAAPPIDKHFFEEQGNVEVAQVI